MAYFILAGGYWSKSREPDMGGRQVSPKAGETEQSIDYIIRIEGLPKDIFNFDTTVHKKYFCEDCKRIVSEGEMENKFGCFNHHVKTDFEVVELADRNVFERYNQPAVPWLKECYRIWMNVEPGCDKWREIWRYVETHISRDVRMIPLPAPVGSGNSWLMTEESVPFIELEIMGREEEIYYPPKIGASPVLTQPFNPPKVKKNKRKPLGIFKCDVCGAMCNGKQGIRMHNKHKHPEIFAASLDKNIKKDTVKEGAAL